MIIINNEKINIEKFSNNEVRVRNIDKLIIEDNLIDFKYESSDDLISLMFIKKRIDDQNKIANLFIRYMPYSRMDREFDNDLFSLKYISDFINYLNFNKVYILEPHSDVTKELINKIIVISAMEDLLKKVDEAHVLVFPDRGAYLRYGKSKEDYILFNKLRDEDTTLIRELYIEAGKVEDKNYLIIDDICSSGNTCNKVAKILKEKGAKKVSVLAVHTEDIALKENIIKENYVDKIYTTNSIITKTNEKIKIIDFNIKNYL